MSLRRIVASFIAAAVGAAVIGSVLNVAIWPGEVKLTAPVFCAEPYNQPMVVADSFTDSEGTSTNYTLYCVGDRGQFTDQGFLLPLLTVWAVHTAIIFVLALLLGASPRRPPEISDRISSEL